MIAADIKSLVSFYEKVTNGPAEWLAPVFAEIVTPAAALAIGARKGQALHVSRVTVRAAGTQLLVRAQNEGTARNDMDGTDCSRWSERSPGLATSPRWCVAPIISSA